MKRAITHDAWLTAALGVSFGEGFTRLNLATTRSILATGIQRLGEALNPACQGRGTTAPGSHPGSVSGWPDSNTTIRARLRVSSPGWLAAPKAPRSSCDESTDGLRAISASTGTMARSSAPDLRQRPPQRPIAVR